MWDLSNHNHVVRLIDLMRFFICIRRYCNSCGTTFTGLFTSLIKLIKILILIYIKKNYRQKIHRVSWHSELIVLSGSQSIECQFHQVLHSYSVFATQGSYVVGPLARICLQRWEGCVVSLWVHHSWPHASMAPLIVDSQKFWAILTWVIGMDRMVYYHDWGGQLFQKGTCTTYRSPDLENLAGNEMQPGSNFIWVLHHYLPMSEAQLHGSLKSLSSETYHQTCVGVVIGAATIRCQPCSMLSHGQG